jgi:uncharacterized protein (UPF0264 family)
MRMAELLVSVRSVEEAEAALEGGAALIDVKEPRHGPLGRASAAVIAAVCGRVNHRRPVSAALGELPEQPTVVDCSGLQYVKWGLAGCLDRATWRSELQAAAESLAQTAPQCRPVAVAYGDWQSAEAPSPEDICSFACKNQWGALLLDTWGKTGKTLLDWVTVERIHRMGDCCRRHGVRLALAGSLATPEIIKLRPVHPDWFAVRGSACRGAGRLGAIAVDRVVALVALLKAASDAS